MIAEVVIRDGFRRWESGFLSQDILFVGSFDDLLIGPESP